MSNRTTELEELLNELIYLHKNDKKTKKMLYRISELTLETDEESE